MNSGNKIICPVCQDKDLKSAVYPGHAVSTTKWCQPYYDENGDYHNHDSNTHSFSYRCSLGHSWEVISGNKCPNCDYGHGDAIKIFNSEEVKPIQSIDGHMIFSITNGTNTIKI